MQRRGTIEFEQLAAFQVVTSELLQLYFQTGAFVMFYCLQTCMQRSIHDKSTVNVEFMVVSKSSYEVFCQRVVMKCCVKE